MDVAGSLILFVSAYLWLGALATGGPPRREPAWLRAAFTALMIGGIAACVRGLPYVGAMACYPLAFFLVVCLVTSWVEHVGNAAKLTYWLLPVTWLAGMADQIRCFCHGPPHPHYYGELSLALVAGSGLVAALSRAHAPALPLARARVASHCVHFGRKSDGARRESPGVTAQESGA
jgi:hypothetical protein